MKRIIITGLCFLMACAGMMAAPITKDLHKGDKLTLNLELVFNDEAKEEGGFISWELVGDWDKFDYRFSQGSVKDKIFTIKAAEYNDFFDGEEGIALIINGKSKTEAETYNLSMKVSNVLDGMIFPKDKLNLDLAVRYILPPPPPLWETLLIPCIILLILVIIVVIVLKVTEKFPKGLLQLGREEVYLKGKSRVSVKEELEKQGIMLEDDCDIIFVKKRFGSFQGPCIKEMRNCALELDGSFVSRGKVLLPGEELTGLKDSNGNEIIIRFC